MQKEDLMGNNDTYLDQLSRRGYAELPIRCPDWELMRLADAAFRAVIEKLAEEVLEETQLLQHGIPNETPLGFTHKRFLMKGEERIGDPKWYCHFHPDILEKLNRVAALCGENPMGFFISYAQTLYEEAQRVAVAAIEKISGGKDTPLYQAYCDGNDQVPHLILRFLAYEKISSGEPISARGHFDKSGGTIPLYETGPGLHIGTSAETASPVGWARLKSVFMAGCALQESFGITPGWHFVQEPSGGHVSGLIARGAIIAFIDPIEPFTVSVEKAHTSPKVT